MKLSVIRTLYPLSLLICLVIICCNKTAQEQNKATSLQDELIIPPAEVQKIIQSEFPGALPTIEFGDSLTRYLNKKYNLLPKDILLGISTCVDDIIFSKNFHHHPEMNGPFHMGGLGGLPFSGVSGLNAYAHHVPDNGAMVLFIGPHIGYSSEKGWGYMLRPGQTDGSSCCGALVGTLGQLEKGAIKPGVPAEDDYQGGVLAQMALGHSSEILSAPNHLIALTKITGQLAESQIEKMLDKISLEHERYIVLIGLILINTDYNYTDYVWVTHFKVYDVKTKSFLEKR